MRLRKRHWTLIFFLIGILTFAWYWEYRLGRILSNQMDDLTFAERAREVFDDRAEVGYQKGFSRDLRYLRVHHNDTLPLLVFIHGAPSSSAFWLDIMSDSSLLAKTNMLAIDRPGYGGSGVGMAMTSVREQAANIKSVIDSLRLPGQPVVVHGSSYGGTVSARLAMDYPDLVSGLLLQSASMMPQEEYQYWITRPVTHWALSWLVPRSLHTANLEKLSHTQELEDMRDRWDRITAPVVILHGTADWLIYPQNAYFACRKLKNAEVVVHHMLRGKEHDLLWTAPQVLRGYLHELLGRLA